MVTYNTSTGTLGHVSGYGTAKTPEVSAADKAGGSIEFRGGYAVHKVAGRGAQSVDVRARELSEIKASASGPTPDPIKFRHQRGGAATVVQAEADPKKHLISIHGRETSLQAALMAGWIVRGDGGNYYDARIAGNTSPGK